MAKQKSTREFINEAKQIHGDRYDYSLTDYQKSNKPLTIICSIHGEFKQTPDTHLHKRAGCQECGKQIVRDAQRMTASNFIEKARLVHGNKFTYDKVVYHNNSTKVIITCPIHGDFKQTPSDHLMGYGCKLCASDKGRFSNNDFISKAQSIHGDLYNYDKVDYINTSTKITITCPKHGDFLQTPNGHLNGQGCKKCKNTRGENQIYVWLKNNNFIDFVAEKTFDDCRSPKGVKLRYDFYLPSYKMLIEFDGAQHFSPTAFGRNMSNEKQQLNYERTVLHDDIKTKYALDNGYQLVRIRFDENVYEKLNHLFHT